jgi:KaiC/GvpD/RAD55 family RecA-like ATPase
VKLLEGRGGVTLDQHMAKFTMADAGVVDIDELASRAEVDLNIAASRRVVTEDISPTTDIFETWAEPIDWRVFWSTDPPETDWLLEPIVPAGRQVAIFSRAKVGKSLFALEGAAALATGRPVLGAAARDPVDVVYIDMEMTANDLRERLTDLGYGPDSDLSRLHYYQLVDLAPLDSEEGGTVLQAITRKHNAQLVVLDTMARAVRGDENQADTYRNFYRHTGLRLKADGVTLLRLDHGGKDGAQGQRGSSAKDDDVDVVFQLTQASPAEFVLKRTRSRIPWVPPEITLRREEEPLLRHLVDPGGYPEGTAECAKVLDDLDVPLDATVSSARAALKAADRGKRTTVVTAALKYRRTRR